MQTTLLGLGIAVILSLLAALIGPLFIDWGQYRGTIETEASRLIGVPVRVSGPIDVRLLPSPSVTLSGVELGPTGAAEPFTTRRLAIEFGLATLMRGEIRADQVTIEGPDFAVAIDRDGKVAAPAANLGFDPDQLAIDRLSIENGRIVFSDAANDARLTLDDVNVQGEVRSLLGPFKVEGTFAFDGEHYGYKLSGSRRGEDGRMKLRLAIDAAERAVAFESDGLLGLAASSPSYEGTVTVSRIVGTARPDGQMAIQVAIKDLWKLTGKLKATATDARLEQLDLQYGRDVRTVHLTGSAIMAFGREPRMAGGLTALQIDLDRVLGSAEQKLLPLSAIRSLAESFAAMAVPRLPIEIDLGVDSLTLGGATLTAVRSRIEHASSGWSIGALDLRGPGATFVHAAGRLAAADKLEFKGPVTVDSNDPATFLAWIDGGRAASRPALGPMRISGTVTIGKDQLAVDGLSADIDRKHLEGHFDYRFALAPAPARLEAALSAGDLDFDRALAIGEALLASTTVEPPGEVTLALDVAHSTYAGIEARNAHADLAYGRFGLKVKRLLIADLGGAAVDASGDIALPNAGGEAISGAPRTSIGMSVSATRLDGVAAMAERFLPQVADPLHKFGGRSLPLRLEARFDVGPRPGNTAAAPSLAKLTLSGKLAGIDVKLGATAVGTIANPGAATVDLDSHLDGDARTLVAFVGLDAFVNADPRPAHLALKAHGTAGQPFQVDAKLTSSGGVNASAAGTMALSGKGTLDVSLQAADSRLPRRTPAPPIPLDLRTRLSIDGTAIELAGLRARIAGAGVTGRLALGLGSPLQVDGSIEADQADAGELVALFTGTPRTPPAGTALWPAAPFAPGAAPPLAGQVVFRVGTARWLAGLVTRDFAGTARFEPSGVSLADATGTLAGGRLAVDAQIRRDPTGLSLQSKATLTDADLALLFAPALRTPSAGRISLDAELEGRGLSASSLVGAIKGTGTVTAKNVEIAGLDPSAVDAVVSAIERDHSLGANSTRLATIAGAGLDAGKLRVPFATAPLVITDGRAQLTGFAAPAQNADVAGSVSLGLDDGKVDARLTITRKAAPGNERPPLAVTVSGPLAAAHRSADTGALANSVMMQLVDQETKRLEEAEKERERREAAEALRREQEAAKAAADGAVAPATVGRAADAPVPDTKPSPPPAPVRRAPPAQPPPPPAQRPFTLRDLLPLGR